MSLFQLRENFNSGAEVILTGKVLVSENISSYILISEEVSVHDVASILKEFFKDLPEPLLPREVYHPLLAIQSKILSYIEIVENILLVTQLPSLSLNPV